MSYVTVSVGVVTACHACVYNRRRQIIRCHSIFIENVLNYNSGTTFSKFIEGGSVFIKETAHRKSKEKFCVTALRRNVHAYPVRARDLLVEKFKMSGLQREALNNKYGGLPPAPRRPGKPHG